MSTYEWQESVYFWAIVSQVFFASWNMFDSLFHVYRFHYIFIWSLVLTEQFTSIETIEAPIINHLKLILSTPSI